MSYSGAYAYHTLNPIEIIEKHQECDDEASRSKLIRALVNFRNIKSEELSFVAKAVSPTLSHFPNVQVTKPRSHTNRAGYLIRSGSDRRLLVADDGEDGVGRENALELELVPVVLLSHQLGASEVAATPAQVRAAWLGVQ